MFLLRFLVVLAVSLVTSTAWAQEGAGAGVPPDVVTTKDGGMYRGTILAKVPGDYVEIALPNGETKKLEMATVQYAGPSEGLSGRQKAGNGSEPDEVAGNGPASDEKTKPTVVVVAEEASLELVSTGEPVTFHRRATSATATTGKGAGARAVGYDEMCTTPCRVKMPAGTHTLALGGVGSDSQVEAPAVTIKGGEGKLKGTFVDNSASRTAGTALFLGGLLGGLALEVAMLAAGVDATTTLFVAVGVAVGGMTIGWIVREPDEAQIEVASSPRRHLAPGVQYRLAF